MNELKWTPGPWAVVNTNWEPWPDAVEVNADNEVICFTGGHDAERQKANARLIAAAPDLAEALEAAANSAGFQYMISETRAKIDAALSKAKGPTT